MLREKTAKFLLGFLLIAGCARQERVLFDTEEGNYLALPRASVTAGQAQVMADQYGAVVKQDTPEKIARDTQVIFAAEKPWEIVITPANRDFMVGIFSKIPKPAKIPAAAVQIYGERTPELASEMERLGLERSVERGAGHEK